MKNENGKVSQRRSGEIRHHIRKNSTKILSDLNLDKTNFFVSSKICISSLKMKVADGCPRGKKEGKVTNWKKNRFSWLHFLPSSFEEFIIRKHRYGHSFEAPPLFFFYRTVKNIVET